MNSMLHIFWQFLKRDWYAQKKHLITYFINYTILNAIIYSFSFAYLQGNTFFGTENTQAITAMFVGSVSLTLFVISYKILVPLLFDLEQKRFIEYQTSILSPRLVLIERILFTAMLTFIFSLPFFPLAKLLVGDRINTEHTSWICVALILSLSSLMCSAYNVFTLCFLKGSFQLTQLWARCNIPMLILAGWVPWHIMHQFSTTFSTIALANPMLYITEGLRQSFLASEKFLPLAISCGMLLLFTGIFTVLAWWALRKRIDYI